MYTSVLLFFICLNTFSMTNLNDLDVFIDNNQEVLSIQKKLESAEVLKGQLLRSFLPKISLSYGREQFSTGPYSNESQSFGGVEAQINLFNSGRDTLESSIRDNNSEIAKVDLMILRSKIKAEIKKSMTHFAYLEETKSIISRALEFNETNLKKAQKRVNAGLSTKTDILDFKQQQIQIQQEISSIQFEIGVVKRLINTLLGKDPDEEIVISFKNHHPDHKSDPVVNLSESSLFVKKIQLKKDSAELNYKLEKKWWNPTLDFYTYAQRFTQKEREYTPSDKRNDVTFGFRFIIPLFDGGEGIASTKSAKSLAMAKSFDVKQQEISIKRQRLDAFKKVELAHELIHGAEENVKIMNDYRLEVLNEYTKGVKNSPDVLQAIQRWIEANIKNAEVKKNYQFAKIEAEYLNQSFSVN